MFPISAMDACAGISRSSPREWPGSSARRWRRSPPTPSTSRRPRSNSSRLSTRSCRRSSAPRKRCGRRRRSFIRKRWRSAPARSAGHHAELRMYPPIPNVISHLTLGTATSRARLAGAHRVFEHSFAVPAVHQGYIEPHTCIVSVGADGIVDIWAANKGPHIARAHMAAAIGVPENRLRFNPVYDRRRFRRQRVADGHDPLLLPGARRAPARQDGDDLVRGADGGEPAPFRQHHVAHGARPGREDRRRSTRGSSSTPAPMPPSFRGPTLHGYSELAGTYRVPNCAIEVLRVYTNTVPRGHMRSPGAPQVTFAVESHIDMIAHELGLDPLEFRRRNAIADGDLTPLGDRRRHMRCRETIDAGARAFGWDKPRAPDIGRGISIYEHPSGSFGRSIVDLTMGERRPDHDPARRARHGHGVSYDCGAACRRAFRRVHRPRSRSCRATRSRPISKSGASGHAAHDDDRAGDCGRRRTR